MNKIKLFNRDGADLYLVPKDDYYVLDGPDLYKSYLRIIYEGTDPYAGKVCAVDPPGGPYMSIGYSVGDNKKISKIRFINGEGTKIYLEDETD